MFWTWIDDITSRNVSADPCSESNRSRASKNKVPAVIVNDASNGRRRGLSLMSNRGGRRSPPRGDRPGNLRSLDRLGYPFDEDEHNRPPETPPYRRNMSQLTLPPEYLSDGGPHDRDDDDDDEDIPPVPSLSRRDEKRPADGDNDDIGNGPGTSDAGHLDTHRHPAPPTLTLQTSDSIIPIGRRTGSTPISTSAHSEKNASPGGANVSGTDQSGIYDGETLVHGRRDNGKQPHSHYPGGQSIHYTDEHGGLLHDAILNSAAADRMASRDVRPPGTRRSSVDSSRAPSVADTDGEGEEEPDEFYDWSDEDDLVDQEAHFETKLNQRTKKKKTWGPRRCVIRSLSCFSLLFFSCLFLLSITQF